MRTSKTVSRKAFANNTFRRVAKVLQTFQAPLSYPARRTDPRYFQVWKTSQSLTFAFSVRASLQLRPRGFHIRKKYYGWSLYMPRSNQPYVTRSNMWWKCQTTTITLTYITGINLRYKIKVYNESTSLDPIEQINKHCFPLPSRFTGLFYEYERDEIGILIDTLMNIQRAARYKSLKNPPCDSCALNMTSLWLRQWAKRALIPQQLKGETKHRRGAQPFGTNVITHRWRDSSNDESSDDNH